MGRIFHKNYIKILENDYILSIVNKVYSIFIGLVSSIFYIRYLGLEYKGAYTYINEITSIIAIFANLGIYQSYPFYFRKEGHGILNKYINIFLLQFVVYSALACVCGLYLVREMALVYVCIQVPFLVFRTQMDNIILVENLKLYMWLNMGIQAVLAVMYFLLWLMMPVSIGYVVGCAVITNITVCILYLRSMHFNITQKCFIPDMTFLREVIHFGFFPMLSALLMTLNYSVDIVFLRFMGENAELSLYSVASTIILYVWVIPNAFKEVLIARVARENSDDQVAFSTRVSLFITFVCLIGFAVIGKVAIRIMFGVDFEDSYFVTLVLFIGAFSMIYFKMLGVVFVTEGRRIIYFTILFISVVVNVAANYFLIPIYGMYGAAFASVVSYTVCGFVFLLVYCKWKNKMLKDYFFINKNDIYMIINSVKERV